MNSDKPKVYGLVIPKKPGQATRARPPPPPKRGPGAAFSLDDDDSDGADDPLASKQSFNAMLAARSARAKQEAEAAAKAALAEDPSIYDYDGVYDAMQAERGERARAAQAAAQEEKQQSKYIDSLKRAAELKKREQDRYFERRLAKERKEEDEQYKDKEVFVTSAYKKKLMEMKKWDAIDKMEEEAERKAADGRTGMDAFYSNLLNNNIALGADVKKAARSAYTVGSARQDRVLASGGPPSAAAEKAGGAEEEAPVPEAPSGPSSRMVDAGGAAGGKRPRPGAEEGEGEEKPLPAAAAGEGEGQGEPSKRPREEKKPAGAAAPAAAAAAPAVDPEEAKRKKEEAVRLARERFLARKKQQGCGAGE